MINEGLAIIGYYERGKEIERLQWRLHKARQMNKVYRQHSKQIRRDNEELRERQDKVRHETAAVKVQLERMIRQTEPIFEENRELKTRIAFYEALEQNRVKMVIKGHITYEDRDGYLTSTQEGDIYKLYLELVRERML